MSTVRIMNSAGDAIDVPTAKEDGVYLDPAGVPRLIVEGDPILPGWEPAGSAGEGSKGKAKKPSSDKAKKAPAEDK